MTTQKEEAQRLISAAKDTFVPTSDPVKRRVSMNLVSDFTGELGRVEGELIEVKEKLAQYAESLPVRKLDPKNIIASKFANRVSESFNDVEFESLKEEVKNSGGNVQPIKVRPLKNGKYEIVYGHRRHKACLEIGLEVLATVHDGITDKELFEVMSRENEQRKNLSAYELATHYKRGIDLKLYKNWSEIAAVLGKGKSLMSRYSALSELPQQIIDAFSSPNDIQPKWAASIRQSLDSNKEEILKIAKNLIGRKLPAKDVFETLINPPEKKFTRVNFSFGGWKETTKKVSIELDKSRLSEENLSSLREYIISLQAE
jgi:ParB family chromosome partitioning protein